MRKPKNRRTTLPFYAWQCVSLQLQGRTVDLVIKNEKSMDLFLKFLIMSLNTLDGVKGSARALLSRMCRQEKKAIAKKMRHEQPALENVKYRDFIPKEQQDAIRLQHAAEIYAKTAKKYRVLRIRSKIAYAAFQQRETVNELLIGTILSSYEALTTSGSIPPVGYYSRACMRQFQTILDGDIGTCVKRLVTHNRDPEVRKRKFQLYKAKELKLLGLRSIEELTDARLKSGLEALLQKNVSVLLQKAVASRENSPDRAKPHGHGHGHEHAGTKGELDDCSDHQKHNVNKLEGGFGLFERTNCADLFENVKIGNRPLYPSRNAGTKLRFKFNTRVLDEELIKVRFVMAVGGLNDVFYIKTILKKKALVKEKFVLELEQG